MSNARKGLSWMSVVVGLLVFSGSGCGDDESSALVGVPVSSRVPEATAPAPATPTPSGDVAKAPLVLATLLAEQPTPTASWSGPDPTPVLRPSWFAANGAEAVSNPQDGMLIMDGLSSEFVDNQKQLQHLALGDNRTIRVVLTSRAGECSADGMPGLWFQSAEPSVVTVDEDTGVITAVGGGETFVEFRSRLLPMASRVMVSVRNPRLDEIGYPDRDRPEPEEASSLLANRPACWSYGPVHDPRVFWRRLRVVSDLSEIDSLVGMAWYRESRGLGPRYDVTVAAVPIDRVATFGLGVSLAPELEAGLVLTVEGEGYELAGDGDVMLTSGPVEREFYGYMDVMNSPPNSTGALFVGHQDLDDRWLVQWYSLEQPRRVEWPMDETLRESASGELVYVNRVVVQVPGYTKWLGREIADDYDAVDVDNDGERVLFLTRVMTADEQASLVERINGDHRVSGAWADHILTRWSGYSDLARVLEFSPDGIEMVPDRLLLFFLPETWDRVSYRVAAMELAAAHGGEVLEFYDDLMMAILGTPPLDEDGLTALAELMGDYGPDVAAFTDEFDGSFYRDWEDTPWNLEDRLFMWPDGEFVTKGMFRVYTNLDVPTLEQVEVIAARHGGSVDELWSGLGKFMLRVPSVTDARGTLAMLDDLSADPDVDEAFAE